MLHEPLFEYLEARQRERHRIESSRLRILRPLADRLQTELEGGRRPEIIFVCTHNSRRSHLAQLWAAAAAARHGLAITTWSGGTEATEFDGRAVAALQRAGFEIEPTGDGSNTGYLVGHSCEVEPTRCFSKIHDASPNPTRDFIAVMVCDEADRGCPHLPGASARFTIPYRDPKLADGTPEETATYDERCREVAGEMLWTIETVASSIRA